MRSFVRLIIYILVLTVSTISNATSSYKVFYVDHYGEDFEAFSKLTNDVNSCRGGRIVFPKDKEYTIRITDDNRGGHASIPRGESIIMAFMHCAKVDVDMNGSTINLEPNHSTKYAVFLFFDCEEFSVFNGTIVGDSQKHDYSSVVFHGRTENSTHEWGHGIIVTGSKGLIHDISISYMTGDGLTVSSMKSEGEVFHAKAEVHNCEISYCRRNGISCASTLGFLLYDTYIHHIGTHDGIIGTAPQAGIDLEYEDGVSDTGVIEFRNCIIKDCTEKVITASNSSPPIPKSILITNCYLEGSSCQINNVNQGVSKIVRDCRVVSCPIHLGDSYVMNSSFDLGVGVHYVSGGHFIDCSFIGTLKVSDSTYGCSLAGSNLKPVLFENCTFSDIRARNDKSPTYQGFGGYHFPLRAVFKKCVFSNCSFVRGNPKIASSFDFYDSVLADGCMIYNLNDDIPMTFVRCYLTNVSAYQTQKGRFAFKKSTLIQIDKSISQPLLLFGNITLDRCSVVDEVGFPVASAKKNGVKAYKINAKRTSFSLDAEVTKTEGMILSRGKVRGISRSAFKGEQHSVRFK